MATTRVLSCPADADLHRYEPFSATHVAGTGHGFATGPLEQGAIQPFPCARSLRDGGIGTTGPLPARSAVRFTARDPYRLRRPSMTRRITRPLELIQFEKEPW